MKKQTFEHVDADDFAACFCFLFFFVFVFVFVHGGHLHLHGGRRPLGQRTLSQRIFRGLLAFRFLLLCLCLSLRLPALSGLRTASTRKKEMFRRRSHSCKGAGGEGSTPSVARVPMPLLTGPDRISQQCA